MAKSTGPNWTVLVIDGRTVPQFGTCTYEFSVLIFIGEVRGTDFGTGSNLVRYSNLVRSVSRTVRSTNYGTNKSVSDFILVRYVIRSKISKN